ncbi:MAG TPA: SCO family protein [Taishania sp.]|nr:SCO family protein [Taishania sp.]
MTQLKIISKALVFFLLVILGTSACTNQSEEVKKLPIIGNVDVVEKVVNGQIILDTVYHKVPDFKYINQDSVWVESKDLKNKIWVTDFMFTYCPSICPPMTTNMKRLNVMTKDLSDHIQFLSFSIDPTRDTPTRLREYMKEYGITANNWLFFTGDEAATHELARSFFNGAEKDDEIPGGYGHTPYFSLVDTKGHIRGIYDGTNSDAIDSLAKDIRYLLKTEYNVVGK